MVFVVFIIAVFKVIHRKHKMFAHLKLNQIKLAVQDYQGLLHLCCFHNNSFQNHSWKSSNVCTNENYSNKILCTIFSKLKGIVTPLSFAQKVFRIIHETHKNVCTVDP